MNTAAKLLTPPLLLTALAVIGGAIVAITWSANRAAIDANRAHAFREQLQQILAPGRYDNQLENDSIVLDHQSPNVRLGAVYRARRNGHPVALIMHVESPSGYNGTIGLLVGIHIDGTLAGARVVHHQETPGLGDAMELGKSDWIVQFDNRSLSRPIRSAWRVRRDGGNFDQLTGATVTSRAVTASLVEALIYFDSHRDHLFAEPATTRRE